MNREARVLTALAETEVPHPRVKASCEDVGVVGAAFYLMEPVDGFNPSQGLPPLHQSSETLRHEMGLSMAAAIAKLGNVDYLAVGLEGFGKPDGYLERQVSRWKSQLESYYDLDGYPGPDFSSPHPIEDWLQRHTPSCFVPGIIHGDYHMSNVMFRPDGAELAAIVDWELATIGDPLLDLGALAAFPTGDDPILRPWDGFPSREALLSHYGSVSDRNLGAIEWYEVLACYRLGIILEGTRARSFAGKASQSAGAAMEHLSARLLEKAHALIHQ